MAKEKPYPLRLEPEQENNVQQVCKTTGLPKALVLRLAISYGLQRVDWEKFKTIPERDTSSFQLNEGKDTPYKVSSSPASVPTDISGKFPAVLSGAVGREVHALKSRPKPTAKRPTMSAAPASEGRGRKPKSPSLDRQVKQPLK